MIPTEIDGTDITGATIDGTDVQEITVDGDVVFSAGPTLPESFERANPLAIYSGDISDFAVDSSPVFDGAKSIRGTDTSDVAEIVTDQITLSAGDTFSYRHFHRPISAQPNAGLYFGVQGLNMPLRGGGEAYQVRVQGFNNTLAITKPQGGFNELNNSPLNIDFNNFMEIKVDWGTNGTITATAFDSAGSQLSQVTANDTEYTTGGVGWSNFEAGVNFDFLQKL